MINERTQSFIFQGNCSTHSELHFVDTKLYSSQKQTAAQNGVLLSYHRVRGLYFLAVVLAAAIVILFNAHNNKWDFLVVRASLNLRAPVAKSSIYFCDKYNT